jgi:hypothetical protein
MPKQKRTAPHPEWVQMYRQGLTTTQIAATADAAPNTVRYHVAIAAAADPSLRDDHRNAARKPPAPRVTPAGLQNLHDTVALYQAEGRLPSTKSPSARERALATWLANRRQDHDHGTLSPTFSEGLKQIPGWEQRTRKTNDEARWNQRLHELTAYMASGNDWPRHKKKRTPKKNESWACGSTSNAPNTAATNSPGTKKRSWTRFFPAGGTGERAAARPDPPTSERDESRGTLSCTAVPAWARRPKTGH